MRWITNAAVGTFVLLVVVILTEVLLARRAPHIDGWTRAQLDGTFGEGSAEPIHIVWIGDSTGDGVGASSPDRALPRLVAEGLSRPVRLTVLANSGSRVGDAIDEQLPQVARLDPDWVIIGVGNNDVTHLTARRRFERDLERLLDGVAGTGPTRVVVLGIAEFAGPLFAQPLRAIAGWRADSMDEVLRSVASRHGVLYVDIKGDTGAAFINEPKRFYTHDGFHPSDEGYGLWARATLEKIETSGW